MCADQDGSSIGSQRPLTRLAISRRLSRIRANLRCSCPKAMWRRLRIFLSFSTLVGIVAFLCAVGSAFVNAVRLVIR